MEKAVLILQFLIDIITLGGTYYARKKKQEKQNAEKMVNPQTKE